MTRKLMAAADHGVDAFIFDWYYYDDGPFLNRCLDLGYLKATQPPACEVRADVGQSRLAGDSTLQRGTPHKLLFPGKVTPETFDRICDHVIKDYFSQPCYWTDRREAVLLDLRPGEVRRELRLGERPHDRPSTGFATRPATPDWPECI